LRDKRLFFVDEARLYLINGISVSILLHVRAMEDIKSALTVIRTVTLRREARLKALEIENVELRKKLKELEDSIAIVHTGSMRLSRRKLLYVPPTPSQSAPPTFVMSKRSSVRKVTATPTEALKSLVELKLKSKALQKIIAEVENPLCLRYNTKTNTLTVEHIQNGEVELTFSHVIFSERDDVEIMSFWAQLPGSPVILE
jgi:hypothetical protein